MCGDVERGRCSCRGRRGGRRYSGAHAPVLFSGAAAGFVLAEYARNGKRRVRRCGRLDGRRFAATATTAASVARRHCGRRRSRRHHHRLAGGRRHGSVTGAGGRSPVVVAAQLVVVVVAGHVDARGLGHAAVAATVADIRGGTDDDGM